MSAGREDTHHHRKVEELPDLLPNGMPSAGPEVDAEGQRLIADGVKRSTTDPLEVNFANATIADALQSKYTSATARFWGWVFFVLPAICVSVIAMLMIWKPVGQNVIDLRPATDQAEDFLFKVIFSVVVWAVPAYWVVVLSRRREQKRGHDRK